ncbi:TonB-dependent receptor domain-containing protein [Parasphingopyxis marina]|uniref:TonB-dependent receptor n=1 Tax=Parasphingopyxis marina TaxID=2761622 RepID=A0A842HZ01_9SPHN|nr:TonB-dependent receptor [Parasphingopyxis marina]MBC2777160.1 TonB-dependent receptor [Parasphingopyxis marina]
MTKHFTLASLLLVSSALTAPAAFAQTGEEPAEAAEETVGPSADDASDYAEDDQQDVDISTAGGSNTPIVVTGQYIPQPMRESSEILSVLSTEDLARTGEGDAAAALQRVSGLSLVGGRFVYVRGLGERYSLALLNGSPLPSPEPLKRSVPLDLFPTSILASTLVQKTYSVNYTGEFGGGVINLTTRAVPDEAFLTFSGSVSGNSETTLETGYTYYGSDYDWFGFDDGTRNLPTVVRRALESGVRIRFDQPEFSDPNAPGYVADIATISQSFQNASINLVQRNDDIPFNGSINLTGGTYVDIGSDFRLGFVATAGLSNSWETRGGIRQQGELTNGDQTITPNVSDYRFLSTQNRIVANGLIGIGAEFGEHQIRFTNLYIRDTAKEARISASVSPVRSTGTLQNNQNTEWFERQLISTQLVGEFDFGELNVDVRANYANAQREAPYEREIQYAFNNVANDYIHDTRTGGQTDLLSFSNLDDNVYGAQIDVTYSVPMGGRFDISAGYAYYLNQRDFERRAFRFVTQNPGGLPLPVTQLRPDYLFSDAILGYYDIFVEERTDGQGGDAYEAELEVNAGYLQADIELFDGFSVAAGVRYEDATQFVNPITFFGFTVNPLFVAPPLSNDYWLPAATLTWNFAEDMQLRFGASKTIGRPQFRELAAPSYTDPDNDRSYRGNPALIDSELLNIEGRFEWYFDRDQSLQIAAFYKDIDNPIEQLATSGDNDINITFLNAPAATLYGFEAEVVKFFPLYDWGGIFSSRRIRTQLNYTYTNSEITVGANDTVLVPGFSSPQPASNYFVDGTALTGQSDHIVNLQLSLEDEDALSQQSILISYVSDRVTNRSPIGDAPDIQEESRFQVDFVWRQAFSVVGQEFQATLELRNIFNDGYREFYRAPDGSEIDALSYDRGRSFSFGLSTTF